MKDWNFFIQHNAIDGGLLQSSGWAQFQRALGRRVEYIESRISNLEFRALAVEHQLPLGQSYVYSPRGPVGQHAEFTCPPVALTPGHGRRGMQNLELLINEVRRRFPTAFFWRIEPVNELRVMSYELRKVKPVQPSTTLIIDLSKTEEELLAAMKQKTRYNIRTAMRHGVTVRRITNDELRITEEFLDVLKETAERDGFRTHAREYYKKLLQNNRHAELVSASPEIPKPAYRQGRQVRDDGSLSIELFCAFHNNQLLAGAIVVFFGQWAYYLHGASSSEHRDLMAPYLLHWEIMRQAKRRGCTKYDLWGAGEEWPGVSKFKTGFAPATPFTHYPGTFDVVFKPMKYWAYRLI